MRALQLIVLLLTPALAAGALRQPALLTNAEVQVVSGADLARVFDGRVATRATPGWIGYAVPAVRSDHFLCDWHTSTPRPSPVAVKLEGPDTLHVLFKVEERVVTRIRMFSEGCAIDAGGLPVTWLADVRAAESVELLSRFVVAGMARSLVDGALAALAMHEDPAAARALVGVARSGAPGHARGQALFWIAQRAGDQAIPAIAESLLRDPDTDVKKKAVFALSQLPDGEGVPTLIDVARTHSNPAVRKQAMFWLGQSRDARALAFFESILFK